MRQSIEVEDRDARSDRDTLFLLSGIALVVFGAGLILSNRSIRQYVGQMGPGRLIASAVPDLERYLRIRAM